MLESEDAMRRQIEMKERMLRAEREEKEMTMQMLRAKQDELDRYVGLCLRTVGWGWLRNFLGVHVKFNRFLCIDEHPKRIFCYLV